MIFGKTLVKPVLEGRKTQTRRLVKPGELECYYRPGRKYAVQSGRGKPAIARITVLDVRRQRLGDLTFDDARAEGFRSRDAFFAYWTDLHGHVDQDLEVWAIRFCIAEDQLRLLAKDGGYTETPARAIPEEPEAVCAVWEALRLDDTDANAQLRAKLGMPPAITPDTLRNERGPRALPPAPVGLIDRVERELRRRLTDQHIGTDAEDVVAIDPDQGTVGDVRRRRKALGQRGTDGLPPIATTEAEEAAIVVHLVSEGRSVRDMARVLDCSTARAHRLKASAVIAIAEEASHAA